MWRWTVLLCLIFYGHISSQPVTDDSENARQPRQLNFGECCPCPSPEQGVAAQESSMSNGDTMFARARDIDDCPCRPRSSDSEGASSIFFPTSMRSDGNYVRPVDKKEELKPLLHPEVDLASSVLQTLREATDEEYQDALARDATRSMAEESIFGDTLPEASSGNIVTIIVNPKHSDSLDDDIPHETHVQESHCLHAPLDSVSTNLGQMRVAQKPPSLLREIFGLPRISKPAEHNNLLDMDNGASNVLERVVHVDNDHVTNKSVFGLRKYAPFMKLGKNLRDKSSIDMKSNVAVDTSVKKVPDFKLPSLKSNVVETSMKKVPDFKLPSLKSNVDVDTSMKKVPDFKLPSMKNKLKDLVSNTAVLESKDKTNSLPLIPKMRFNNPLFKLKGKNEEDLSLSPNNIHEQAKKSFFQTKSHLENIFQNTRPVDLKTLLKLKDVEFVPLKDLVPKSADRPTPNRPKLAWPDIFKKRDTMISSTKDRNTINVAKKTEIIEKIPKSFDAEVSPSNVIERIIDDNCNNRPFKTTKIDDEDTEAKIASIEIIDTASSPPAIEEIVSEKNPINVTRSTEIIEKMPKSFDAEVSPSNVIERIIDDKCNNGPFKTTKITGEDTEAKIASIEIIDTASSPSEIEEIVSEKNPINVTRSTEIIEKIPKSFDAEVSPSNVIEQINDDSCNNGPFKTTKIDGEDTEAKIAPIEIIDTASSPSENEEIVSEMSNELANSQSNELPDNTDDCSIKTLPATETNLPQSMESSFESEAQSNNKGELNFESSKESIPVDDKADNDPESELVSNDKGCVSNTNDADSITDSSNNTNDILIPKDTVLENVDNSLVNENTATEEDCSQELSVSDHSKTFDVNPSKLIKPLSLDEKLSSIKEKIAKHIENLKNPKTSSNILDSPPSSNIIENKESSPMADEKVDFDCQNKESIQVTTVKPDICNVDLKIENESDDDKVSMQDLQKISDEMLQEEQERESNTLNCKEPTQEVIEPKEPIEVNSAENENADSEQSANTQNDVIMDPQNIVDQVNKNDNDFKNTCQSDLTLPKQSFEQDLEANVAASEVVINRTPQITSPFLPKKVLEPNENVFSLNIPLPDIQDIKLPPLPDIQDIKLPPLPDIQDITLPPLPTLDEIKLSFNNLFDKPERDVEGHSASEAASMIDTSNILAPIMSTDASAKRFQSILPPLRLEDVDLDFLQLKPQSNLFSKIPKLDLHSFRTKLPLSTDLRLKPLKLQSAFEDKNGLLSLGQNYLWETIPGLDDFGTRVKANTQKIAKTLRKPDTLRHSLKSSQGIGVLSDTKQSLKNMQHTLESKLRGATIKPVNLQSNDLLEAITRNHEDVNDKLRALHIDFNDRLETMRNNLFDMSIFGSGESRSTESFSTFSNNNKDKKLSRKTSQPQSLPSRRESKKTLKPQRLEQQKETRMGSSRGLQNKFKMPTAASVPVPRTIEVPELKATLTKSPGLGIQRASGVNPIFQNTEATQPKESTQTLWRQASKKLPITNTRLGKTINPYTDSKIKLSSTPRPSLSTKLQSRKLSTPSPLSLTSNLGKNTEILGQRQDHKGSPSEMKHSIFSPPISSQADQNNLENYGLESESRRTGAISTWKLGDRENLEQPKTSKDLWSWPQLSESAFLSKVKEALKARMLKMNSPVTFKQTDTRSVSSRSDNGGVLNSNTDMTRSASTNIDVVDRQALKENVSYKCTMVCNKE